MADDLALLRADVRALTRAGRLQAEAIAAADTADEVRVAAILAKIDGVIGRLDVLTVRTDTLALKVDGLKPAADYFAARGAKEGEADGESSTADMRIKAAVKGATANVLEHPLVRAGMVSAFVAWLAWLGLETGAAGEMQELYSPVVAEVTP